MKKDAKAKKITIEGLSKTIDNLARITASGFARMENRFVEEIGGLKNQLEGTNRRIYDMYTKLENRLVVIEKKVALKK